MTNHDNHDLLRFATKAEAVAFLDSLPDVSSNDDGTAWSYDGTYVTKHGEYARPTYEPRRYRTGWGIKKLYYYYSGTCYAPIDHRVTRDEFAADDWIEARDEAETSQTVGGN